MEEAREAYCRVLEQNNIKDVELVLFESGVKYRITERDGEKSVVTRDFDEDRVNLVVEDDLDDFNPVLHRIVGRAANDYRFCS